MTETLGHPTSVLQVTIDAVLLQPNSDTPTMVTYTYGYRYRGRVLRGNMLVFTIEGYTEEAVARVLAGFLSKPAV